MDNDYFVMLIHPSCGYVPLMEDDENMAKFETEEKAKDGAEGTCLGSSFGYEVFCMGMGC